MPATRDHDLCLRCRHPTGVVIMRVADCDVRAVGVMVPICLPCFLAARAEPDGLAALPPITAPPAGDGREFGE